MIPARPDTSKSPSWILAEMSKSPSIGWWTKWSSSASADMPAPVVGDVVPVSAVTGYGLDTLRVSLSSAIAGLWEDVDVCIPYTEGELLARVRERGTVEVDYRDTDVRINGRVVPSLAGELRAAAGRWDEAKEEATT